MRPLPLLAALAAFAAAPLVLAETPARGTVSYDAHGLIIDGKPTQIYSGAFHYFRCPKELWRDRFRKIKEAGFNTVETYVSWNEHEKAEPAHPGDFSKMDLSDLVEWMRLAHEEFGLHTIIRPGPYICAEWNFGGYPRWLYNKTPEKLAPGRPVWLRSDDPSYLDWSQHWMDAVAKVVAPEQITAKPRGAKGVILFQIENEYDYWGMPDDAKKTHLKRLYRDARAAGITVPIFTCWTHNVRNSTDADLKDTFDAVNLYNRMDIAGASRNMATARKSQPGKPGMVAELQGGWFANVGGTLSEDQQGLDARQINAITMAAIANGASITNYYMLFGGSHFGQNAGRDKPATYDYNAPIRETGAVGDRYARVKGLGAMIAAWGDALVTADPVAIAKTDAPADAPQFLVKRNPAGDTFVFAFNKDAKKSVSGTATLTLADGVSLKIPYALADFDYRVCRLAPAETDAAGKRWLPEPAALPKRPDPASLPKPIRVATALTTPLAPAADAWRPFADGTPLPALGVFDQLPVAYRAAVTLSPAEAKNFADLSIPLFADDRVVARVNGVTVATAAPAGKKTQHLDVRGLLKPGANTVELVYEDLGSSNWDHSMANRYGLKSAALAATAPTRNLADWRSRLVPDAAAGAALATRADDGKGDTFTLDATTLGELGGVHQPGADLTRVAAAKILENKKAVALFRSTVTLTENDLRAGTTRLVFECLDDRADIFVNGQKLGSHADWSTPFAADAAKLLRPGANDIAVIVTNADGRGGITKPVRLEGPPAAATRALALEWAKIPSHLAPAGAGTPVALDTAAPVPDRGKAHPKSRPGAPLVAHTVAFDLPAATPGVWVPWHARIEAAGNGHLYLNGHHIGRYWQAGMQRAFYLPECWLRPGARNTLVLEQLATDSGNDLRAVEITPAVHQAELR